MATDPSEFFLVAKIGQSERLVELSVIREVVPAMLLAAANGVTGGCCGLANIRGEVVPVYDLMHRGSELDLSQLVVVVQTEAHRCMGIVVDDVLDLVELACDRILRHPTGLGRHARSANLAGKTLSVLSVSEVLDAV